MKVLLVGVGGYGQVYAQELLQARDNGITVEGIVEVCMDRCPLKAEIEAANIPIYATMEAFYAEHKADLAVISTPTFLHCTQSIQALRQGSYVLCEKPAASLIEEAKQMQLAQQTAGKFIAIGFQWAFHEGIQQLKQDILAGKLGKPISLKTFVSWPRSKAYFARGGGWGGRIAMNGNLILDSIISNACAHYMQNMLFVLGNEMNRSAMLASVEAECARANTIENFDVCVLRCRTADGVMVYFSGTHAGQENHDPEFEYTFQNAVVRYQSGKDPQIVATFSDGTQKKYGDPTTNAEKKLWDVVQCIKNGTTPVCTVETAMPHTALVNTLYHKAAITDVPQHLLRDNGERVFVEGLYPLMEKAYGQCAMLSELGCTYTKRHTFVMEGNENVL